MKGKQGEMYGNRGRGILGYDGIADIIGVACKLNRVPVGLYGGGSVIRKSLRAFLNQAFN